MYSFLIKKENFMRKLHFSLIIIILLILPFTTPGQNIYINAKTESYGGSHAPLNAVVIWIQTSDGKHIYTPQTWGTSTTNWMLKTWRDVTGLGEFGWFDGVTEATRQNHDSVLSTSWDCKDTSGKLVEKGSYEIWVEMSESDFYWKEGDVFKGKNANAAILFDFDNDKDPVTILGQSTAGITQLFVKYFPKGSAISFEAHNKIKVEDLMFNFSSITGHLTIELGTSYNCSGAFEVYTTKGMLVRSIPYIPQTRTIYWNGRNDAGDRIASGIYLFVVNIKDIRGKYPIYSVSLF